MSCSWTKGIIAASGLLLCTSLSVADEERAALPTTILTGFQETPPILTNGTGSFRANVNPQNTTLAYTLTFSSLSSNATAAHIHFAQFGVAGGVVAFLCGGGGKPLCPAATTGTVNGTITAADIMGIPTQGVVANNLFGFAELLRIIQSGDAYVNVHSVNFPGGEIRGQLR